MSPARRVQALELAAAREAERRPAWGGASRRWLHGVDLFTISNAALDALEAFWCNLDAELPPAAMRAAFKAIVRQHDG